MFRIFRETYVVPKTQWNAIKLGVSFEIRKESQGLSCRSFTVFCDCEMWLPLLWNNITFQFTKRLESRSLINDNKQREKKLHERNRKKLLCYVVLVCPQRWYAPLSISNDVFLTCHPLQQTRTLSSQSQKHRNINIKQIPLVDRNKIVFSNLYFHFSTRWITIHNYYYYLTTCDITRLSVSLQLTNSINLFFSSSLFFWSQNFQWR